MSKTITQTVKFKGASAKDLFNLFMDAKLHAAATGEPADISKKTGEAWKAYKGGIRGRNLFVSPQKKIVVQTWRARGWKTDSILTMQFEDVEEGAQVTLVHALVPDEAAADIKKGWRDMYWNKWKAYLKQANK